MYEPEHTHIFSAAICRSMRLLARLVPTKRCLSHSGDHCVSKIIQNLIDARLICRTFPDSLLKAGDKHKLLDGVARCVYAGFDPTADSLHVGNLTTLCALMRLQSHGFTSIVLLGEATARLGDPTGRLNERPAIDPDQLSKNCEKIKQQIEQIMTNNPRPGGRFIILNNAKWYDKLSVGEFYTIIGRTFRLRHLMDKQSVVNRLHEGGMNFSEFSYQIFQAYDWLRLYNDYGCLLQLGGVDQTGNVHSGHDLIRAVHGRLAYGLFTPLLLSSTGEKLGKTQNADIWLCPTRTTPYQFYQHFATLPDDQLDFYYALFTFDEPGGRKAVLEKHFKRPELRTAQYNLAKSVTALVHGSVVLERVLRIGDILHGGQLEAIGKMNASELEHLRCEVPSVKLKYTTDKCVTEWAVMAGCFQHQSTAKRVINQGGFYINGKRVTDPSAKLSDDLLLSLSHAVTVLRVGRKNYRLIWWL